MRFSSKLFMSAVLFGVVFGITSAIVLFALTAQLFAMLGNYAVPFGLYAGR